MHKAYCVLILSILSQCANAQQKLTDSLILKEATIDGMRPPEGKSLQSSPLMALQWAVQPLSEISYKSYGPSGVGSLSYRSLPANQTRFTWNGIDLSSAFLGQADVNQIPIGASWQAQLVSSKQSTLIAGSAAASSVSVKADNLISDTCTTGIQAKAITCIGSLGSLQAELTAEVKKKRWDAGGRYFYTYAQNAFYIHRPGNADPALPQTQQNAIANNRQAEGHIDYKSRRHFYKAQLGLLLNSSHRQLPPPVSKYFSRERLDADLLAFSLSQHFSISHTLSYDNTLGSTRENSLYTYENGTDTSPYAAQTIQLNGRLLQRLITIPIGIRHVEFSHSSLWSHPITGAYPPSQVNVHTVLLQPNIGFRKITLEPKLYGFAYHSLTYMRPGFTLSWSNGMRGRLIRAYASSDPLFRAPTLNDLFYPSAGNHTLAAEQGRVYECSINLNHAPPNALRYAMALTPFLYDYSSLIVWLPKGNLWRPEQRIQARVSGFTASATLGKSFPLTNLELKQELTLSQGGYGGAVFTLNSRPETFLYTPPLRSSTSLSCQWMRFQAYLQMSYTSRRHIDSQSEGSYLPSYLIYTLKVECSKRTFLNGMAQASAQVSIASRPDYQFIANYAAPRAWGSLALTYQIGHER